MVIEFSARALREMQARNRPGDEARVFEKIAISAKRDLRRPGKGHGDGPDLPFPARPTTLIPTTSSEAYSFISSALEEQEKRLQARGLNPQEVQERMVPFRTIHERLSHVVSTEEQPQRLPSAESDIAFALHVFANMRPSDMEPLTAVQLLTLWQGQMGLTLAEMSDNVGLKKPSQTRMYGAIHRKDTGPGFLGFALFLKGLDIESTSAMATVLAEQIVRDEDPTPGNERTASLNQVRAVLDPLLKKQSSLGKYLATLINAGFASMREFEREDGVDNTTMSQIEHGTLPHPSILFKVLAGMGYYSGSVEAIVAVQLALIQGSARAGDRIR